VKRMEGGRGEEGQAGNSEPLFTDTGILRQEGKGPGRVNGFGGGVGGLKQGRRPIPKGEPRRSGRLPDKKRGKRHPTQKKKKKKNHLKPLAITKERDWGHTSLAGSGTRKTEQGQTQVGVAYSLLSEHQKNAVYCGGGKKSKRYH